MVTWVPWDVSTINPQGVWQRYQGELAGALGVNALPDNELTRRVLKVSCLWLEIYHKKNLPKKRGKIEFVAVFLCVLEGRDWIWGSMTPAPQSLKNWPLLKYEGFPPTGKKPSKRPPWEWRYYRFFEIVWIIYIYIYIQSSFSWLISRFWRVYHPHWKKVKGFSKTVWKIYGTLGEFWAALL